MLATGAAKARIIRDAIDGIDSITDVEFREHYSGRGMGSRDCIAVIVDNPRALIALGMSIAYVLANEAEEGCEADAIDDAVNKLGSASVDSIGRSTIVYWPHISATA